MALLKYAMWCELLFLKDFNINFVTECIGAHVPLPLCRGQRINGRNSSFFVHCESQGIKTRSTVLAASILSHWVTYLAYGMSPFCVLKQNKSNKNVTSIHYTTDLFMHNTYLYKNPKHI